MVRPYLTQWGSDDGWIPDCLGSFYIEIYWIQVLHRLGEGAYVLRRDSNRTHRKFFANKIWIEFNHTALLHSLWCREERTITPRIDSPPSIRMPLYRAPCVNSCR